MNTNEDSTALAESIPHELHGVSFREAFGYGLK